MADALPPMRRSPLFHRVPVSGTEDAVRLSEAPFVEKFILRADPHAAVEPLRAALGIGLPFDPLTVSTGNGASFLWLGPDEWMLVSEPDLESEIAAKARASLAGLHHQLVDVSDYYTIVDVAGPKARALLMKLTTLDLHPRAFRAGMVSGAVFGRANATIWQSADDTEREGPAFRLFIRWSMADYLWCLLADAGREWGVPEQVPISGEQLTIGA